MFKMFRMLKKSASISMAFIIAFALMGCVPSKAGLEGYYNYSEEVFANGIYFIASLKGEKTETDKAYAEMKKLLADINSDMSLSLSSSALAEFNASKTVGFSVEIQKFTYDVINKSLQISDETGGAFNIAVTSSSKLWNVDTDGLNKYGGINNMEDKPAPPKYEDVLLTKEKCNLKNLECYELDGKYYIKKLVSDLKLDLGAIAKGYSADECIRIAKKYDVDSALIDISGNLCLLGKWFRGEEGYFDWQVGVTSPRPRGAMGLKTCAIKLTEPCTIVTSGDYSRFYTDYKYAEAPFNVCHIINPITGMPINIKYDDKTKKYSNTTDGVISATIITQNSAEADAYATAVCALGYTEGVKLMQRLGLKGIIITEDNKMALVGISQDETAAGTTLTLTEKYNDYKKFVITEY